MFDFVKGDREILPDWKVEKFFWSQEILELRKLIYTFTCVLL